MKRFLAPVFLLALSFTPALAQVPIGDISINNVYPMAAGVPAILNIAPNTTGGIATFPAGSNYTTLPANACTGSDDTSAITTAIAGMIPGSTLLIPVTASGCKVSSTITIGNTSGGFGGSITIQGAGPGAKIVGTLGSTTDLFHIFPTTGELVDVWFQDLQIAITGGQNVFNFDSTHSASLTYITRSGVRRVNTLGSTTLSGASVKLAGSISTSYPFDITIEDGELITGTGTTIASAAINISGGGDTIRVLNGEIAGQGYGTF